MLPEESIREAPLFKSPTFSPNVFGVLGYLHRPFSRPLPLQHNHTQCQHQVSILGAPNTVRQPTWFAMNKFQVRRIIRYPRVTTETYPESMHNIEKVSKQVLLLGNALYFILYMNHSIQIPKINNNNAIPWIHASQQNHTMFTNNFQPSLAQSASCVAS